MMVDELSIGFEYGRGLMFFALAVIDDDGRPRPALFVDGEYYALDDVAPDLVKNPSGGLLDVIGRWDMAEPALVSLVESGGAVKARPIAVGEKRRFLPLVLHPSKIMCAGTNYYDHVRIDGAMPDFDKNAQDVMFFSKHLDALVGSGGQVRYPSQSAQFDYEIELVVVFGREGRRIAEKDALSYVAGYAVGIDFSARDWQRNSRHLRNLDLLTGKSFDDSAPLGPHFVPARFVDPADLSLRLTVNGEVRQDSHTREMIWSIPELVAALSQHMTIKPGDLLFTGTPAGVALASGNYLQIGDHIEGEISGLGKIVIDVIEDPDARYACPPAIPADHRRR